MSISPISAHSQNKVNDTNIYIENLKIVDGYTEQLPDGSNIKVYDGKTGSLLCDSLRLHFQWIDGVRRIYGYYGHITAADEYIFKYAAPGYDSLEIRQSMLDKRGHRVKEFRFKDGYYVWQKVVSLNEVTVKASKILMVNKGDTIVYNAANFRMRQGSMLDDLIRALPGAAIDENGKITINGQFVSSVLIQGRDFFNGDPRIALRNLPAYTVNKIKVYRKAPDQYNAISQERSEVERQNDPLVMDVGLKRDYQQGLISNYEAGGGTSLDVGMGKWLARLFALRYTNHSSLAVYGSANNISDDASPGDKGEWRRNEVEGDLKTYKGGVSLQLNPKDSKFDFKTNVEAKHQDSHLLSTEYKENYYLTGNTFRHVNAFNDRNTTDINWNGEVNYQAGKYHFLYIAAKSIYTHNKENVDKLTDYLEGNDSLYVRRLVTRSKNDIWSGSVRMNGGIYKNSITVNYGGDIGYRHNKGNRLWSDFVDYSDFRQKDAFQWSKYDILFKNYNYGLFVAISKRFNSDRKSGLKQLYLRYDYSQKHNSDNQELLRSNEDLAPSALTPDQLNIDLANSYHTTIMERSSSIHPKITADLLNTSFSIEEDFVFTNRKIHDFRNSSPSSVSRHNFTGQTDFNITYKIRNNYSTRLQIDCTAAPELPSLLYLLNVRDGSDPLNISLGNGNLKTTWVYLAQGRFFYEWQPLSKRLFMEMQYRKTDNAVGMASLLDRKTGITTTMPMNVDGNWHIQGKLNYSQFLDKNSRWNIASELTFRYQHSVDFTGTGQSSDSGSTTLEKRSVSNTMLREKLRADCRLGQWSVTAIADLSWRWARSHDANFRDINFRDFKYGLDVSFPTLLGFDLVSDIMAYSRWGYMLNGSNSTDWVWNVSLNRSFGKSRQWLVKATGFDILQQLSAYRQSVNAQGNTEMWTNSTPSYVIATITYRLDLKPKKKSISK